MTTIHGIAYIFLGMIVSGISYFLDKRNNNNSFVLFFYLGIVFIIVGILKLWIKYIQSKPDKQQNAQLHFQHPQSHQSQRKICNHCGFNLRHTDHFCPMCGYTIHQLR